MRKLIIIIPIILLFLASGCITGFFAKDEDLPQVNVMTGGPAYEYNPSSYLPDWELVSERPRLGRMPLALQAELNEMDILDAATWEFKRGDESLYVWVKLFETKQGFETAKEDFTSMFVWRTYTRLLFADGGAVGVYDNMEEIPTLVLYTTDGLTLIHIAYYNEDGHYNKENISEDQQFLISLAKNMLKE